MNSLIVYLLDDCLEDQYLFESKISEIEQSPFKLKMFDCITSLENGVKALTPDIIVTDLNLPECTGLDTFLRVKKITSKCPLVILTGCDDEIAVKAIQLGAQDYLIKNELKSSLIKRTLLFAKERFSLQKALEEMASRDSLTKLYNRESFDTHLIEKLQDFKRYDISFALIYIDIDNFKPVNDDYGHLVGDKLLELIANRITFFNRVSDFAARIGGDEFVIIAPHINTMEELTSYVEYKRQKLCGLYALESKKGEVIELNVTMSFGGSIVGVHGNDTNMLLEMADKSMYLDKKNYAHQ